MLMLVTFLPALLHQLGNALTMLKLLAGRFVQVRSELGECRQFTVLSQSDIPALVEQCRSQMQQCLDRMEDELARR